MRNVIRNILTNWRNIFGKKIVSGLPYEYIASVTPTYITIQNGYGHGQLDTLVTYTYGGNEYTYVQSEAYDGFISGRNYNVDIGSTVKIELISGECIKLIVDGVTIFDNN